MSFIRFFFGAGTNDFEMSLELERLEMNPWSL
jgi:hypothetical protein